MRTQAHASISAAILALGLLVASERPARADETGAIVLTTVVGAVDLGFGVYDTAVLARKELPLRGVAVGEAVVAAPQVSLAHLGHAIFVGMSGANDHPLTAALVLVPSVTDALLAHGIWGAASTTVRPDVLYGVSAAIGVDSALTTAAVVYGVCGRTEGRALGAGAMMLTAPQIAVSSWAMVKDPGNRPWWGVLVGVSGAHFVYGLVSTVAPSPQPSCGEPALRPPLPPLPPSPRCSSPDRSASARRSSQGLPVSSCRGGGSSLVVGGWCQAGRARCGVRSRAPPGASGTSRDPSQRRPLPLMERLRALAAPKPVRFFEPPARGGAGTRSEHITACGPNLSASSIALAAAQAATRSADTDPIDRRFDRFLAHMGLLDDAAPLFWSPRPSPCSPWVAAAPSRRRAAFAALFAGVFGFAGGAFFLGVLPAVFPACGVSIDAEIHDRQRALPGDRRRSASALVTGWRTRRRHGPARRLRPRNPPHSAVTPAGPSADTGGHPHPCGRAGAAPLDTWPVLGRPRSRGVSIQEHPARRDVYPAMRAGPLVAIAVLALGCGMTAQPAAAPDEGLPLLVPPRPAPTVSAPAEVEPDPPAPAPAKASAPCPLRWTPRELRASVITFPADLAGRMFAPLLRGICACTRSGQSVVVVVHLVPERGDVAAQTADRPDQHARASLSIDTCLARELGAARFEPFRVGSDVVVDNCSPTRPAVHIPRQPAHLPAPRLVGCGPEDERFTTIVYPLHIDRRDER